MRSVLIEAPVNGPGTGDQSPALLRPQERAWPVGAGVTVFIPRHLGLWTLFRISYLVRDTTGRRERPRQLGWTAETPASRDGGHDGKLAVQC